MTFRPLALLRQHRIDSRILMGFLVSAVVVFLFMKIASEVMEGDPLAFDRFILQALRYPSDPAMPVGPAWLRDVMIDWTALGGMTVLTMLTVATFGYLLARGKKGMAILLAVSISGGALMSGLLKIGFARQRPDIVPHLVEVHTTSFPSGHAMNSAIIYLTLGVLLARAEKDRFVRIYILSVAILLTLSIGVSRVYLGVHWPSDVIAGWCIGACWAALCSIMAKALQRRHRIEQPTIATESA